MQALGGLTADDTIFGGEENVQFGTAHVSSGGTTVAISGAGTAVALTITSRGLAVLNSGGFALDAAIVNSGALDVHAGAGAFDTTVGRGAVNILRGFTSRTTVNSTGFEIIAGGNAIGTRVNRGGVQAIHFQGTARQHHHRDRGHPIGRIRQGQGILATIGGTQFVNQGGVASASLLQNGGTEIGLSGGTTIATVFAGGALILSSGVIELGNVIFVGSEVLSAGAIASDAVVFGQGEQIIAGGTALETTVRGGGTQAITQAGTARNTFVSAFGVAIVSAGGVETNATIFTGGTELVSQGGLAQGATLSAGGIQFDRLWRNGNRHHAPERRGAGRARRVVRCAGARRHSVRQERRPGDERGRVAGRLHRCLRRRHFARSDRVPGRPKSVNGVAVDTTLSGGAQDVNSGGIASGTIVLSDRNRIRFQRGPCGRHNGDERRFAGYRPRRHRCRDGLAFRLLDGLRGWRSPLGPRVRRRNDARCRRCRLPERSGV